MYNVSNSFREAMKKPAQFRRLYGTVGGINFVQKNILQGTFAISNQCSSSSEIQIGQVYVGEMKIILRNIEIPRGTYKGREVKLKEGLFIDDNSEYEYVPLGVYCIQDATWSLQGVSLVAYDNMSKFDKTYQLTIKSGEPFDFLTEVCKKCGVELGMTREEVSELPNGKELLGIYEENDIETYRDLISWIAQTTASNAMVDFEGKLILKQYSQNIVESFDIYQRDATATFSDFESYYTGMSIVDKATEMTKYYSMDKDDGLVYNLGSNPMLQNGVESVLDEQRKNVLYGMQSIKYTPFKALIFLPFVLELMDVIEFKGGNAGNKIVTCVTKYQWSYGGKYSIQCVGKNPALQSARSKVDKNIAGLLANTDSNQIQYYQSTNSKDIEIRSGTEQLILSTRLATKKPTTIHFIAEILLESIGEIVTKSIERKVDIYEGESVITSGQKQVCEENVSELTVCKARYYLDGAMFDRTPTETWYDGKHILTLNMIFNVSDNSAHTFNLWLECSNGTIKIPKLNAWNVLFGQGLASKEEWDGNLAFDINLGMRFDIQQLNAKMSSVDLIGVKYDKLINNSAINERFGVANIFEPNAIHSTIVGGVNHVIGGYKMQTSKAGNYEYDSAYVDISSGKFKLNENYVYESQPRTIDEGYLTVVEIKTDDKQSIESVVIE